MADQSKKDPQPFNASLFGGSSGLTFDLDQASMLSPFSIGAAKKVEESPPKSAGSTPTPPGKSSPGLIPKSTSKTKTPSPTPVLLFQSPTPSTFEVSNSQRPATQAPVVSSEPELEVVSLVPSPVHPDPPLVQNTAMTQPVPSEQPPPAPVSLPPPTTTESSGSGPPVGRVPPMPHQGGGGGGGLKEESNPYRLSGRPMGRPSQPPGSSQQTFTSGGIVPPPPSGGIAPPPPIGGIVPPPPTGGIIVPPPSDGIMPPPMSTVAPPPVSTQVPMTTSGYSPIMPPPTTGAYAHSLPSQTAPPTYLGGGGGGVYIPVRPHWFFLRSGDYYWMPFTQVDSTRLEQLYQKQLTGSLPSDQTVTTDGGRYDVLFVQRKRKAVYWDEGESQVRRGTWFYRRESDRWYTPYEEDLAARLEEEYHAGVAQNMWNRRIPLVSNEVIVMHSATSFVHYPPPPAGQVLDIDEQYTRPKAVRREFTEADQVSQGEQRRVDHLVFVIHGIGPCHDLNFRSIVDCVDDFREVSQLMIQTHAFRKQAPRGGDDGGRVEYLPIHWHAALHSCSEDGGLGVDKQLQPVTLKSIKRLRDFTNETLLDILYYTSPVYAQTIITQVSAEMNRLYHLFVSRNPSFSGGVSVIGHSLGSCIAFDLLAHQGSAKSQEETVEKEEETEEMPLLKDVLSSMNLSDQLSAFEKEQIDYESLMMLSSEDLKELGIPMGPRKKIVELISRERANVERIKSNHQKLQDEVTAKSEKEKQQKEMIASLEQSGLKMVPYSVSRGHLSGTGQSLVEYPTLDFTPENLFAVGSPIALFLTVRGVDAIGPDFALPSCQRFFNVFHPYDPVAYRIEPLIDASTAEIRPVLLPHHKGRKRFHLELYDNLGRVGASLKENIVTGMKNMWVSLSEFARSHTSGPAGQTQEQVPDTPTEPNPPRDLTPEVGIEAKVDPLIGKLNGGNRIDHVLQEKPIEKLNEYLFALSSHLTYWRSEDTALFVLKQAYQEPNPELIKS